jgi:hypothetical protein
MEHNNRVVAKKSTMPNYKEILEKKYKKVDMP